MPSVKDIMTLMESWAPLSLAESWDNPGLMVGSIDRQVTGIVTSLDLTKEAVDYAMDTGSNMIISHHPLIFKGLKSIDLGSYQGQLLETLIKNDIAVYSAHTNLDIAQGGLNDMLASQLGLENCSGLVPVGQSDYYKLVVYVPISHGNQIRQALAEAGAGWIGNYSHCSFSLKGDGRFQAEAGTHPYLGEEGQVEEVQEERVETIVPQEILSKVLGAIRDVHPYEEVAYDVFPLVKPKVRHYLGRIGTLPETLTLDQFKLFLEEALPHAKIRFAGQTTNAIKRLALCSGGGAEFLGQAKAMGADAYLTGDVKYHDGQRARELGLLVADGGHFGTEEIVAKGLKDKLTDLVRENGWNLSVLAFEGQEDFFF